MIASFPQYTKLIQRFFQSREDLETSFEYWQFNLKSIDFNVLVELFDLLVQAWGFLLKQSQPVSNLNGLQQSTFSMDKPENDQWLFSNI